jgi:NADH dehydrogenase/NADH:ubiquinone oxidoreductase subunit G
MMTESPKVVYMLLADEEPTADDPLFRVAEQTEFLIVQASYQSPLTTAANVAFPSPIWAEREGTYLSLDGTAGKSKRVLELPAGLKDDLEIIARLAQRLKKRSPIRWPK